MTTNAKLLARRTKAIPRGVSTATPIFAARAENARLWDAEGREYIDFAGGIAVLNTGHRHPKVIAAVRAQLDCFTHTAFQVCAYEPYIELAEKLNARAPIAGEARTILFTTGAEAVENAVKIARAATGRSGVICFSGAFHGRTALTMAMTGKVAPYKNQFGPSSADVFHVPFPASRYSVDVETSLLVLDHVLRADIGPDRVAAIVLEPVQGEGGFHQAPLELMRALRKLCDTYGIVLIADEVQSGFARTGKLFAMEHYDVHADLITMAKSLAGGFPLSGVVGRADIMDRVDPGGLGGTYGGSPIGCAAALAVLDVIETEDLCARAEALGARAKARLKEIQTRNDMAPIDDIRGLGSMIAFDLITERGGAAPDGAAAKRTTVRALEEGLILLSCGVSGETIRLLYPLTIEDDLFDQGLLRLETALKLQA
ncbi:4-aminobutyrate--2-oxoglutarate transaminase [Terricaulis sp.]|uniref:4-aminobutyrate--2-oxoglutarate transaminase n=1 Tax=Terricaulis sp. TaxID=2768686 RepID=UPI002AC522B1|nr:4-aminobutyrate--2-oxoglutarate transaminase [Terricaulis sp.]MDZ4691832.1 4-aminobutyrate--2-oxoglutarate transaminase [Terricaulis sp.]